MNVHVGNNHAERFINGGQVVNPDELNQYIDQRYVDNPPALLIPEHLTPTALSATIATQVSPKLDSTTAATTYATKDEAIAPPSRRIAPPQLKMITNFKSGHGWTFPFGSGTVDLNATADPALGTQFVRVTTDTTAAAASIRRITLPTQDLTNKLFAVLVRVSDPSKLGNLTLYVGNGNLANNEVLKYANNLTALPANQWEWVYFSYADLFATAGTPNRANITDFMLNVGSNGTGSIVVDVNALAILDKNTAYPNGVVSFGFDDGYSSALTLAAPKLDEFGYAADLYLILDLIGTAGRISIAEIQKLVKYHRWGIGAHTATLANHNAGFPALPIATVEADLRESRRWLMANGFGAPDYLALPLAQTNAAVQQLITKYYSTARGASASRRGVLPPENPMYRNAVIVSDAVTSLATLTDYVDKAYANGLWLEFIIHDVVSGTATGNQTSTTRLNGLIDYIATKGIPVDTVHRVMRSIS